MKTRSTRSPASHFRWLAFGIAFACIAGSFAATFPSRSIRMIVPVAPGGPTDLLARKMMPKLTEAPGQQVVSV
jgi:tripartite-type tricarboxylate transporter receptor subunit TctC